MALNNQGLRLLAWKAWAAVREDTQELISVWPDVYAAKHAALSFEHEHGAPCSWREVKVVPR